MEATSGAYLWRPDVGGRTSATVVQRAAFVTRARRTETRRATLTFREWLDHWLELCASRGLRATTVASYRTMINLHVDAALAAERLANVTPAMLDDLYGRLLRDGRRNSPRNRGRGLSPRTVRYLHTILKRALEDAVRLGSLISNPASAASPPSPRASKPPVFRVWSPAELGLFLQVARDDALYVAFYLAAATGLRRGEVLGSGGSTSTSSGQSFRSSRLSWR